MVMVFVFTGAITIRHPQLSEKQCKMMLRVIAPMLVIAAVIMEPWRDGEYIRILYHASPAAGLKKLLPMRRRYRHPQEGPVVFASPEKALACAFLIKEHSGSWVQTGAYDGVPVTVIRSDRDDFVAKDSGGTLYAVSGERFAFDQRFGSCAWEWTSRRPARTIVATHYPSALDAMIENGLQVYFVDQQTFAAINAADDHGASILAGLVSENQRRGMNIRQIVV